ncbi:hypothetical protein GLW08_13710 [Pontibacillus yanchengensis]|uniref:Uncharacterized protein n=2 Tax=Pontibacillus yanchengensis TaxID=462910 RepID=A0ACC7VJT3_9BACI|nr:hypothetical protein [Pontibacillus yanchengensis]MYL35989.1 hypothetical protein [Pontibacillus yanchengensis]MYL54385.1 hypothetical protein [Pontibacillus yanchengensis]
MSSYTNETEQQQTTTIDEHNRAATRTKKEKTPKKPWYNQGWVWLIVTAIGLSVLFFLLRGVIDQLSQLTQQTSEQTKALQEQTQVLQNVKDALNQLAMKVQASATKIADAIKDTTA